MVQLTPDCQCKLHTTTYYRSTSMRAPPAAVLCRLALALGSVHMASTQGGVAGAVRAQQQRPGGSPAAATGRGSAHEPEEGSLIMRSARPVRDCAPMAMMLQRPGDARDDIGEQTAQLRMHACHRHLGSYTNTDTVTGNSNNSRTRVLEYL